MEREFSLFLLFVICQANAVCKTRRVLGLLLQYGKQHTEEGLHTRNDCVVRQF